MQPGPRALLVQTPFETSSMIPDDFFERPPPSWTWLWLSTGLVCQDVLFGRRETVFTTSGTILLKTVGSQLRKCMGGHSLRQQKA